MREPWAPGPKALRLGVGKERAPLAARGASDRVEHGELALNGPRKPAGDVVELGPSGLVKHR